MAVDELARAQEVFIASFQYQGLCHLGQFTFGHEKWLHKSINSQQLDSNECKNSTKSPHKDDD